MADDTISNNIKFVEIVEKYPCIYDYNLKDYSKREMKERAWAAIANEIKDSAANCKEKWKHLRTAFSRSLKKPPSGSGSNKKQKNYYLKDVMQFVLPFLKINPQSSNLPSTEENTEIFVEDTSDASVNNEGEFSQQHETEKLLPQKQGTKRGCSTSHESESKDSEDVIASRITNTPATKKMRTAKLMENTADQSIKDYLKFKTSLIKKSSPDLDFFKSLLPDIEKMSDSQKRLFKRKTIELIDTILCVLPQQNLEVTAPLSSPAMSTYSVTSGSNQYSTANPFNHQNLESTAPLLSPAMSTYSVTSVSDQYSPANPVNHQCQESNEGYTILSLNSENNVRSFIHNFTD